MRKIGAVALLVFLVSPPPQGRQFTRTLPEEMPSLEGWEKITGEAELDNPRMAVHYEFYVNPGHRALYEVVRYRIELEGSVAGEDGYQPTERLQWQAGEKILRRFECQEGAEGPCHWREIEVGSLEYDRETGVILWLYGLHRRLLQERDQGTLGRR